MAWQRVVVTLMDELKIDSMIQVVDSPSTPADRSGLLGWRHSAKKKMDGMGGLRRTHHILSLVQTCRGRKEDMVYSSSHYSPPFRVW